MGHFIVWVTSSTLLFFQHTFYSKDRTYFPGYCMEPNLRGTAESPYTRPCPSSLHLRYSERSSQVLCAAYQACSQFRSRILSTIHFANFLIHRHCGHWRWQAGERGRKEILLRMLSRMRQIRLSLHVLQSSRTQKYFVSIILNQKEFLRSEDVPKLLQGEAGQMSFATTADI